jgi:hypothetical protein
VKKALRVRPATAPTPGTTITVGAPVPAYDVFLVSKSYPSPEPFRVTQVFYSRGRVALALTVERAEVAP